MKEGGGRREKRKGRGKGRGRGKLSGRVPSFMDVRWEVLRAQPRECQLDAVSATSDCLYQTKSLSIKTENK